MYDYDIKDKTYGTARKRRFPVVSVSLIVVGFAMIIGGAIYAGTTDMSKYQNTSVKNVSDSIDGASIKNVEIKAGFGDITILKSEDNEVHLEGNVPDNYTLNDHNGTLLIELNKGMDYNLTFFDWNWDSGNVNAKIYLPASEFDKFDFEGGAGDITISGISCKDAEISAGAGDINIDNFTCDTFTVKAGAGDVDISKLGSNGKLKVEAGAGDINVTNSTAGGLDLDLGVGEFTYDGEVYGDIDVDAGVGDCEIKLTNDEKEFKKNYEIDIDHGIGDAKVSFK